LTASFLNPLFQINFRRLRFLGDGTFSAHDLFAPAAPYLFTIAGWAKWVEIDTSGLRNLSHFMKRIYERPAVQRALEKEDALDYV
jgi:glutathione S-transferase